MGMKLKWSPIDSKSVKIEQEVNEQQAIITEFVTTKDSKGLIGVYKPADVRCRKIEQE
jgi:hypothetical protein